MKVILTKDHETLGEAGNTVKVKDGYARNYLIPRSLGLEATKANTKIYEESKKQKNVKKNREEEQAGKLATEISKLSLTASVQVGEDDKVFGAITSQDISSLLSEKGFTVDKRDIILEEPIKALGIYNIPIKVLNEINAEIKLWVIKE